MDFTLATTVAIGLAILVGAVLQRLSGSGMGLILAPTLTLMIGAANGVLLANATTTVTGFLMAVALRRHIDWHKAGIIIACVVPGSFLGAWVVKVSSAAWLQVIVGAAVLGAICFTAAASWLGKLPHVTAGWPTPAAGLIGGFFNTICGVSAPVLVIHSRLTRWEQQSFAATLQPIFMSMGAISVLSKTLLGSTGVHGLPPWWVLPFVVAVVVAGIGLGALIARRVSGEQAKTLAMFLAGVGGVSALLRGLMQV